MQITKELLQSNLDTMKSNLVMANASANKIAGAIIVIEDLIKHLDTEEPKSEEISDENKAIQDRDEAALSLQDVAEIVAGPGATAEEPQPIYDYEDYSEDVV